MDKVYFRKDIKSWWVKDLSDFYGFKSVDFVTNLETEQILSWSRNQDLSEYEDVSRMYDIEIEGEKYFFLFEKYEDGYLVYAKDNLHLENLINKKNIFLTGDTLD